MYQKTHSGKKPHEIMNLRKHSAKREFIINTEEKQTLGMQHVWRRICAPKYYSEKKPYSFKEHENA